MQIVPYRRLGLVGEIDFGGACVDSIMKLYEESLQHGALLAKLMGAPEFYRSFLRLLVL